MQDAHGCVLIQHASRQDRICRSRSLDFPDLKTETTLKHRVGKIQSQHVARRLTRFPRVFPWCFALERPEARITGEPDWSVRTEQGERVFHTLTCPQSDMEVACFRRSKGQPSPGEESAYFRTFRRLLSRHFSICVLCTAGPTLPRICTSVLITLDQASRSKQTLTNARH